MSTQRAYLELHIAVLLFGFTAVLGRLISLDGAWLVWYRMGLTTLSLLIVPGLVRSLMAIPPKECLKLAGIGVVVALHWVSFFASIKLSTVSVALSCLGTSALFTAVLEPLIARRRFRPEEFLLGLFIIPGVLMIHHFTGGYGTGILLGVLSALLASLFGTLNKVQVSRHAALPITLLELGAGWLFLTLVLGLRSLNDPSSIGVPQPMDWLWLLILALLCTTLAYVLGLRALSVLSAFVSSLSINLEPLYGILLAMVVFAEHKELSPGFYAGAAMILLAVFIHPFLSRRIQRNRASSAV